MSDTLYVELKKLEKAFDNIPTLETEQRIHEMVDAIKKLGETLRGCFEVDDKVNDNAIKEITGSYGMTSTTLYLDDEFIDIPRRKHKKKRIQKKWARRYGYKTIIKPYTIENLKSTQTDNGYEFTGVLK